MRKSYRIAFLLLIIFSIQLSGQNDSINQLDSKGKKIGYWICYLDERAMPVDSANAYLFGYEFYDNGKCVFHPFISEKNLSRYKITYDGKLPVKGKPVPINGTLKWLDTKGGVEQLVVLDEFENGYPKVFKEYASAQGLLFHMIDFTKKYNNQPGTFYVEYYYGVIVIKGKERVRKYWCRKDKNEWKECEIK